MTSSLYIQVAEQAGKTILKNCFFNPPYKVANITEDKNAATLHLMLMSASPGVLDGDSNSMQIDVEENAALRLHTQSYQRIYTMKQQATQQNIINIRQNAQLCFIPHPVVPHKTSSFIADTKIYLEKNASLVWGEVISCGRKLNGEIFLFSKYHSKTSIYYQNKLVLKENLLLEPSKQNLLSIGQWQQYTHQATLIFLNDQMPVNDLKEKLLRHLSQEVNISFGISKAAFGGFLVRILGQQAEQLFDCLRNLSQQILNEQQLQAHAF